jgi:hypothetical protein
VETFALNAAERKLLAALAQRGVPLILVGMHQPQGRRSR